jgi:ubiquinone/menaquinone biosynthesis C-methylase UbiE
VSIGRAEEHKHRVIAHHSARSAQFAAMYASGTHKPHETCFAYSRHRLAKNLARFLPEDGAGRRLLDVGCGTGHHLARLRAKGFEVAGVDGSGEMIARARVANPGVPIEQADVEALPFASGQFDLVLCVEVLRYLPDISPSLREMARVLRPGGVCLATAAPWLNLNGYWLVNRLASTVGIPGLAGLKQYFHTSARLRRAFRAAGFGTVSVHGVYVGPVNWVERLAPRALPAILRRWERLDAGLADRPVIRELANMYLVHAVRDAVHG